MNIKDITKVKPPWLIKSCLKPLDFFKKLNEGKSIASSQFTIIRLNGTKMQSWDDFHDEVSLAFQFPDYYGRNFNALDECLEDLNDWLPLVKGWIVYIENSELILAKEEIEDVDIFLRILNNAGNEWSKSVEVGEYWDRVAYPFHTILFFSNLESEKVFIRLLKRHKKYDYEIINMI